jgi:hypothetical protein
MAFSFEFDAAAGVVLARFEGRVTDELLVRFYRVAAPSLLATTNFRGSIIDFSEVTEFDVTPQIIRALAWSRPANADSSRIRVIVAPAPNVFGLARMFASHGEDTRPNLHVVRTLEQAYAVCGAVDPKFEPIG